MGFKETILFMLNMINRSLQTELNSFFEKVLNKDTTISKQAFSENRQKIDPKAFIELNDRIIKVIYEECDVYELWNGYRLTAVDGSIIELPNTEELREVFGSSKNQRSQVARARVTGIFDVINKIMIKSKIDKINISERAVAEELILEMLKDSQMNELILFDRGYPSKELISLLIEKNAHFVMRLTCNFYKQLMDPKKEDQIIIIRHKRKDYRVRILRFLLDSGVEEILLTNMFDEKLKTEDFKSLYFMRWGIETKYDELKNRLEIENFSGTTKVAIEQDFYASIYLSNMIALAREDSDDIIKDENKNKELKYEYKTNTNIFIGSLKDKFILMFMETNKRRRDKMYKKIMAQVSNSRIPIRPNRQNPRPERMTRAKYTTNRKRSL